MKDLQTNRSDKTVYITADARARFASVTDVIDNLRTAGVDQLGLITEAIQDKTEEIRVSKRLIERERSQCQWQLAVPAESGRILTLHRSSMCCSCC